MFSKGFSSEISLATVTPSWVTLGAPNFLSRATLRPLGPSVLLTAPARISMPFLSERRSSSSNISCFAIVCSIPSQYLYSDYQRCYASSSAQAVGAVVSNPALANHGENVVFFEDEVLFAIEFEFGAAVFGEQDAITFAYI